MGREVEKSLEGLEKMIGTPEMQLENKLDMVSTDQQRSGEIQPQAEKCKS